MINRRWSAGPGGAYGVYYFLRGFLYCALVLLLPVPAAARGSENSAMVSFVATFLTGIPLLVLFLVFLRKVQRAVYSLRDSEGPVSSRRRELAVIVILAIVLMPLFPVILYCISAGPYRGESAVIVSALFGILLAFPVLRVVVSAVTAMLRAGRAC